jgi:hypothetical protein
MLTGLEVHFSWKNAYSFFCLFLWDDHPGIGGGETSVSAVPATTMDNSRLGSLRKSIDGHSGVHRLIFGSVSIPDLLDHMASASQKHFVYSSDSGE